MRRRDLLWAAGGMGVASRAAAFGTPSKVDICELDLGAGTLTRPNAWKRMLYEVIQTTSVECEATSVRLGADDPELFQHPFTVLLGNDGFADPSAEVVEQLERYLQYGGFLVIDDTEGLEGGDFDRSVRALVSRLFPTRPLGPLPPDHSVYRSFFLLRKPLGRLARFDYLEGVAVGNLAPIVYCRNDLSGALDRGDDGLPKHSCVPGGEGQRREALKLGINLVLYSLTANYKKDQAHVRQLMKEGRLE